MAADPTPQNPRSPGLSIPAAAPHPAEPRVSSAVLFRGRPVLYVAPGEIMASAQPRAVKTILGSCVAVCLWDSSRKIGGITHYLLPALPAGKEATPRYGDVAISALLERLYILGTGSHGLVAKVFGGAAVVESPAGESGLVGEKNIHMAHAVLERMRIPLVGEDVGGHKGRKLIFCTDEGSAWMQFL